MKLLFMLAIKEPKEQVNILKKLVSIFQATELLCKLTSIEDENELTDTLNSLLMKDED